MKTVESLDGWRKFCDNSSGNCFEFKHIDAETVGVRNSRQPGLVLYGNPDEWSAFVAGAKNGAFDA